MARAKKCAGLKRSGKLKKGYSWGRKRRCGKGKKHCPTKSPCPIKKGSR